MWHSLPFANKQTGSLQVSNFRQCIYFFLEIYAISGVFLGILEHTRTQLGASSSYSPRLKVFSPILFNSALSVSFLCKLCWITSVSLFLLIIFENSASLHVQSKFEYVSLSTLGEHFTLISSQLLQFFLECVVSNFVVALMLVRCATSGSWFFLATLLSVLYRASLNEVQRWWMLLFSISRPLCLSKFIYLSAFPSADIGPWPRNLYNSRFFFRFPQFEIRPTRTISLQILTKLILMVHHAYMVQSIISILCFLYPQLTDSFASCFT